MNNNLTSTNQNTNEIAKWDSIEIINKLFGGLNEREKDVLTRRFGLEGNNRETLESIGNSHKLTRERVRQIEVASVKKMRQMEGLEDIVSEPKKEIMSLLEEHGGLAEKDYLLNVVFHVSFGNKTNTNDLDKAIHKNNVDFLISRLLHDRIETIDNSKNFKNLYKLKHETLEHFEDLIKELLDSIEQEKKTLSTDDLIKLMTELESFRKHQKKLNTYNNIDISSILGGDFFKESIDLINDNKALYSILQAAKRIEQNKFGHWGIHNWSEIKPKTINEKLFLVLKNHNKPMHFSEIADRINQIRFDKKIANAATVHNELILDDKYVLVGKGLYTLKEWGYKEGTVSDIISDIISTAGESVSRDEIIKKVLEQRFVKDTTVVLALMDKSKFEKAEQGKYKIKLN